MRTKWNAMAMVAAIAAALGVTGCSSQKEVPMLVGLDLKTAEARVAEHGFKLGTVAREFSGQKTTGTVLRQVPTASLKVDPGTTIHLAVEESVLVPNLSGNDLESASRTVANQGLRLQRVEKRFVGGAALGAVISQQPPTGTAVPSNAPVDLVVDDFVVVPDFTGESFDAVRVAAPKAGLTLGRKSFVKTAAHAPGTVLAQEPEAAIKVARDTVILLQLAEAGPAAPPGTRPEPSAGGVAAPPMQQPGEAGQSSTRPADSRSVTDTLKDAADQAVKDGLKELLGGLLGAATGAGQQGSASGATPPINRPPANSPSSAPQGATSPPKDTAGPSGTTVKPPESQGQSTPPKSVGTAGTVKANTVVIPPTLGTLTALGTNRLSPSGIKRIPMQ